LATFSVEAVLLPEILQWVRRHCGKADLSFHLAVVAQLLNERWVMGPCFVKHQLDAWVGKSRESVAQRKRSVDDD
jgi:hypothetical protein